MKKQFGDYVVDDFFPWLEETVEPAIGKDHWLWLPINLGLLCALPAFIFYSVHCKKK
jgi:hypothetical protein